MNDTKRSLTIVMIVMVMVLAFLVGTATVTKSAPGAPQALTLAQWAASACLPGECNLPVEGMAPPCAWLPSRR